MSERLDRIESLLEQLTKAQVKAQQQITSNARAIEANSNAIAELRASQQEFTASIEDVVGMVGSLGQSIEQVSQQADQDRLEFRSTVRSLLEALTQRFSGNGHG